MSCGLTKLLLKREKPRNLICDCLIWGFVREREGAVSRKSGQGGKKEHRLAHVRARGGETSGG